MCMFGRLTRITIDRDGWQVLRQQLQKSALNKAWMMSTMHAIRLQEQFELLWGTKSDPDSVYVAMRGWSDSDSVCVAMRNWIRLRFSLCCHERLNRTQTQRTTAQGACVACHALARAGMLLRPNPANAPIRIFRTVSWKNALFDVQIVF